MATYKAIAAGLILLVLCPLAAHADELQATKDAYRNYIQALETRLASQNAAGPGFLWIDRDVRRRDAVRKGETQTEKVRTPEVPNGTLEHWIGGEFIPGATLQRVIQIDQDYTKYAVYYAPEILRSRLISHSGNHFTVYYRLKKHEVVTAVLDTIHGVDFFPLADNRYFVRSRSEDIREVQDAGEPGEKVLPQGRGMGFLWAMNSYWRMEQRDGGVYLECEVVTLGRSIPYGMKGLVSPIIKSLASQSLSNTLTAKRRAVLTGH